MPTHNRRAALERLLGALAAQHAPAGWFEVVVVADGCEDDTVATARACPAPFVVRVVEQPPSGAAAARNRGATEAAGDTLVFLDDDMTPAPELVMAYHRTVQGTGDRVALGPAVPVLVEPLDLFQQSLRLWWAGLIDRLSRPGHRFEYRDIMSGNFAVGAELFRRAGAFDSALRCREDHELGARFIEAGARFVWVPEASALHHDGTDLDRSLMRARAEGGADLRILRRHPPLAPTLGLGTAEHPGPTEWLSRLALSHPGIGAVLAGRLRRFLGPLERMRARRRWRALYGAVRGYWYWRGVADELAAPCELALLLGGSRARAAVALAPRPIELNLQDSLEAAEATLERTRPMTARLRYGREPIGTLPAQIGVERLHGGHLRPALTRELARPLLAAAAVEHAVNSPDAGVPRWVLSAHRQ